MTVLKKIAAGFGVIMITGMYSVQGADHDDIVDDQFQASSLISSQSIEVVPSGISIQEVQIPISNTLVQEIANDGLHQNINDKHVVKEELTHRWWYERLEYHWWNVSACCCRMTGASFESAGLLAFFVSNGLIPILAVCPLSDQDKVMGAVIVAGINYLVVAGPRMVRYAFQIASEREKFATDIAETGGVREDSINTPNYGSNQI